MADIHTLPVQRKRGRRRTIPTPGIPSATVLRFDRYDAEGETAEQKLARINQLTFVVARDLLRLTRDFKDIVRIVDPDFRP